MSSNKKQTTLGYVKSQTTLGRFFTLAPGNNPAVLTQSKLRTIDKPVKPTDGHDVVSPKVARKPAKGTPRKTAAPENDGSDRDEGDTKAAISSEMEMSDASGSAIDSGKKGKAPRGSSTKKTRSAESSLGAPKRGRESSSIKKEAGVSEDDSPPSKRPKNSSTSRPSKKRIVVSDPEATNKPKSSATRGALDSGSETAKPPVAPKRAKQSAPAKKSKKRVVSSDSEATDKPESSATRGTMDSDSGTAKPPVALKRAKQSAPAKKSKKRVVSSDSEATDKPESSATRGALDSGSETAKPPVAPKRPKQPALAKGSKKRVVSSDSEATDNPESSAIRGAMDSDSEAAKPPLTPKKSKQSSPVRKSRNRMVALGSKAPDKPESSVTRKALDSDSETEKPSLAPAAGREMIKKLSKSVPPAYPDWVAGEPTPYAALVTTFNLLESTTKRLEKISHTSRFLRQVLRLSPDELLQVIHLMINKLAADFEGVEMGIGESLLMKAIGESCGRSLERIREDQKECGDLGLVAMKSRNKQKTIFAPQSLTIALVHKSLLAIATTKGEGGQGRKVSAIRRLLASAKGDEAKFLIRGLEGKLRLGLADRTVLVSLSSAMITHEEELSGKMPTTAMLDQSELNLRSVYSELPSYEIIVPAMRKHGIMNIKNYCKLQPGVPVKPMLAKPTKAISEVLDRFENKRFTCEYKYDGERAQIHYVSPKSSVEYPPATLGGEPIKDLARVFSRNSEDLSGKYPDILAAMNNWVRPEVESFVLDCEAVGWDETNNRLLPFQMLQTRKKKDVALKDVKIRVCVHAFDLLFLNGKPVVRESFNDRRKLMHETFIEVPNQFVFARYMDSSDLEGIRLFLDQSVKDSCEGLMVKMMDGPESFYEPSQRSRNWLKIKKDYIDKLGDSLDLVVIGAYWGKGKRTSVYGSFLLACYNTRTQNYESVCNIGTGFTEAELEEFYETLHPLEIDRAKPFYDHPSSNAGKPDVWFQPKVLWEVKAADLTLSPRYKAAAGLAGHRDKGISLRFPRFIGPRTDKTGEDATSSSQIAEMYLRQDQVAHKTGAKGVDDDFEY